MFRKSNPALSALVQKTFAPLAEARELRWLDEKWFLKRLPNGAAEDPDVGRARAHLSSDGNEGLIPGWAITRSVRPLLGFRPEIECGPDQASVAGRVMHSARLSVKEQLSPVRWPITRYRRAANLSMNLCHV